MDAGKVLGAEIFNIVTPYTTWSIVCTNVIEKKKKKKGQSLSKFEEHDRNLKYAHEYYMDYHTHPHLVTYFL